MGNPTNPVLVTPINGATVVGNVLQFIFTVPSDTDNDKLVFRVELDTISPISSSNPNYRAFESRLATSTLHGKWEVKNGVGDYITLPTGGIGVLYYGNDAKITIRKQEAHSYPNSKTTWYWQVSAGDGMSVNPVFNQVTFAQAVFTSV